MFKNQSDITDVLQNRIDQLFEMGGGEITIPPGEYYFKQIELKSHVCLILQAGAKIIASPRREDYLPIGYHHNEMKDVYSTLYAMDKENITLRGEGEIDLNGTSFYHMDKPSVVKSVGPEITQEYLDEAPRTYDWRVNQPIFFHRCKNIRFDGITITNSPCWTLSFNHCQTVKMTNLTIDNSLILPNNDGIHFTGSRDILISGCHITAGDDCVALSSITAGDDCVALSSITDWSVPCENVVISNCVFQSASKALSIGYMHSIVRNVLIDNIVVKQSNRAFVSMCHPHTGLVENIRVSNCVFEGRSYGGNWWGNGEPIVLMVTPHHISSYREPLPAPRFDTCIRNVSFSNITCIAERPIGIVAIEPLIHNVQLRNVTIQLVPEIRPSLKGNVIDLAPGPENYTIPRSNIGVVHKYAPLRIENVTDPDGHPVEILDITRM